MDWTQTIMIIGSVLGVNLTLLVYLMCRQDKFQDKYTDMIIRSNEILSKSNERIAIIEGYLFKKINELKEEQ